MRGLAHESTTMMIKLQKNLDCIGLLSTHK